MNKKIYAIIGLLMAVCTFITAFNDGGKQGVSKLNRFSIVSYKYEPKPGMLNPPTSKAQVIDQLNWDSIIPP